ncbi:MAG: hypothetical protein LAN84_08490 [Acidobacteriia bacterium]|nr:hypothetical protein [Terriglobia bacterium]
MLVQDNLGYVHEVPDSYGQVAYDGFGNPVGLFPGIFNAIKGLFGGRGGAPPVPPGFPSPSAAIASAAPQLFRQFVPIRRCAPPVGWTTPALPYTGPHPRRLYMRCSVWPGPAGLVPVAPGQWPGAPGMPGAPGGPGAPGMPGGGMRRRHMRFRRRR